MSNKKYYPENAGMTKDDIISEIEVYGHDGSEITDDQCQNYVDMKAHVMEHIFVQSHHDDDTFFDAVTDWLDRNGFDTIDEEDD